jgi:hypothetical protein
MRKKIDLQSPLFGSSIPEIKFDPRSRDEIPQLLTGLQEIYKKPDLRDEVMNILIKVIPENIDKNTGRPGMDMWQILVLGTLRLNCNWDYDKVQEIANEHRKVRMMLGFEENDFQKRYPLQTIKDNISLLTPEILSEISRAAVNYGHSLMGKRAADLHGNCDSFAVETDVHYPTDINLLFDAVRKILTIVADVFSESQITQWRQHKHNLKKIKKLFNNVKKLKRSGVKDPKKKEEREKLIRYAYQTYIDVVSSMISRVKQCIRIIRETGIPISVENRLMTAEHYIFHANKQSDLIKRRIFEGETIPHDEKIFSIFEEHTEWICKGKAGVNQELGVRVCIVKDQFGFILNHQVMEKVTDDKIAVRIAKETKIKFNNLRSCSFDKGFYTPDNKKEIKGIIDLVILPKKGRLSEKEREEEYSEEFIQRRQKHSGVESSINALENHALDRCPDHGINGFKRYVSLAVLARNIQIIGRIVQQRKLKKFQKQEKKIAA